MYCLNSFTSIINDFCDLLFRHLKISLYMEHLLHWNIYNGYSKCIQDSSIMPCDIGIRVHSSIASSCVWLQFWGITYCILGVHVYVEFIGSIPSPPAVPKFKYLMNVFLLQPAIYHGGNVFQYLVKSERFWNVTSNLHISSCHMMNTNIIVYTNAQVYDMFIFKLVRWEVWPSVLRPLSHNIFGSL